MHERVADVMTRDVVTVHTDTPFDEVVHVLTEHRISGAPVLDPQGRVAGMVTEADLLGRQARAGGAAGDMVRHLLRRTAFARGGTALTAGDLMTTPAVTVDAGERLPAAAATLARHGIKRAVVVDAGGAPAGILSRKDLLSVYLRSDIDLAAEIRSQVLTQAMSLPPGEVTVDVADGIVTLSGQVERHSMIEIITVLTEAVDGVVGVRTQLTARVEDTHIPRPEPETAGIHSPLPPSRPRAERPDIQ